MDPRVLKLKDFINSAGKKFEKPENSNHINLLYINWTYSDIKVSGFKEAYGLLYNNLNGILKNKEKALEVGITSEALEKITAIVIYEDSFESITFNDYRDVFKGYRCRLLINKNLDEKLIDENLIFDITGMRQPIKGDQLAPIIASCDNELEQVFEMNDELNRYIKEKVIKSKIYDNEDNFVYFNKEFFLSVLKKRIEYEKQWGDLLLSKEEFENSLKGCTGFLTL